MKELTLEETQKIHDLLRKELNLTADQSFELIYNNQSPNNINATISISDYFEMCCNCDEIFDSNEQGCHMSEDYINDILKEELDDEEKKDRTKYCLDKNFCSIECEESFIIKKKGR